MLQQTSHSARSKSLASLVSQLMGSRMYQHSAAPNRGIRAVDIAQSILPALYITQYIIRNKQRWPHRSISSGLAVTAQKHVGKFRQHAVKSRGSRGRDGVARVLEKDRWTDRK
jgi:hypothetical protein